MPSEPKPKVWRPRDHPGVELERIVGHGGKTPLIYVENFEFSVNQSQRRVSGYMVYNGSKERFGTDFSSLVVQAQSPDTTCIAVLDEDPLPMQMWTLKLSPQTMQHLLGGITDRVISAPHFKHFALPSAQNDHLAELVHRTVVRFEEPASRLEREALLLEVARTATAFYTDQPDLGLSISKEPRAANLVKARLLEHPGEDVGLEQLSALTGLGQFQVLRAFRQAFHTTPHRFQMGVRVSRSKRLLQQGRSIAQVSSDLGFYDQAHFSKVFKRYTHASPLQFVRDSAPPRSGAQG